MNADAVNSISLGAICAGIVAIGVLSGFFGKFFAQIYKIKQQGERLDKIEKRMDGYERAQKEQKDEVVAKVEETNTAVNLLCSAISALIDNEISENGNLDELKRMKQKLDDKKELV